MCGLAGILVSQRERNLYDWYMLHEVFTTLLLCNEERGFHATGVATIGKNGAFWYKSPLRATEFVETESFGNMLNKFRNGATALIGHTRWATQGSPSNNTNNHPIVTDSMVGTHNGTITNAGELFKRYAMPRQGLVDSEVIFRIADKYATRHGLNMPMFLQDISMCRGAMSAVLLNKLCPTEVTILKGNRPLFFRFNPRIGALAYASNDKYLQEACDASDGWQAYSFKPMVALNFTSEDTLRCWVMPLRFRTEDKPTTNKGASASNVKRLLSSGYSQYAG